MDPDGSGEVDFDEFYHWYTQGNADPESPQQTSRQRTGTEDTAETKELPGQNETGIIYKEFYGFSN